MTVAAGLIAGFLLVAVLVLLTLLLRASHGAGRRETEKEVADARIKAQRQARVIHDRLRHDDDFARRVRARFSR